MDRCGKYSFAEGGASAEGNYSHAEGSSSLAKGVTAHAEGYATKALGYSSHAEGSSTIANGYSSHAEGRSTMASGYSSHAECEETKALGDYSHAEGRSTIANGYSSHAECDETKALANASHAEGQLTIANGFASHAEGRSTKTWGGGSHAEGSDTTAGNEYYVGHHDAAHAEGYQTTASGVQSHAEGCDTIASGAQSHAGGLGTRATAEAQTAIGKYNVIDSKALFIVGNGTNTNPKNAFSVRDIDGVTSLKVDDVEVTSKQLKQMRDGGLSLIGTITERVIVEPDHEHGGVASCVIFGQELVGKTEDADGIITLNLPDELLEYVRTSKLMHVECVNNEGGWYTRDCYGYIPTNLTRCRGLPVSFSGEVSDFGDPWLDYNSSGTPWEEIGGKPIRRMYLKDMLDVLTYEYGRTDLTFEFYA